MIYNFFIKNIFIILTTLIITLIIILIELKEYIYKKNGLTPHEAITLLNNNNAIIIDFRTQKDFNNAYIIKSINIPLKNIEKNIHILKKYKKRIIIIIEDKKYNNNKIKKILEKLECQNTMYIADGIHAWIKNELPIYKEIKNEHINIHN